MTDKAPATDIGRLHHVSIQTLDWERSLLFYGEVLGLPCTSQVHLPNGKRLALFGSAESTRIELASPPPGETPSPAEVALRTITHLAFEVKDVSAVLDRIRAHELRIRVEPTEIDTDGLHATIAFFEGPNGESIELIMDHADGPADD